jgi:hypothetical protein
MNIKQYLHIFIASLLMLTSIAPQYSFSAGFWVTDSEVEKEYAKEQYLKEQAAKEAIRDRMMKERIEALIACFTAAGFVISVTASGVWYVAKNSAKVGYCLVYDQDELKELKPSEALVGGMGLGALTICLLAQIVKASKY